MSNQFLKWLALVAKIVAIMVWILVPWVLGSYHHYDENHRLYLVQNSIAAVLSLVPNRWLVFSRVSFSIFLLLALLPFDVFLPLSVFRGVDLGLIAAGLAIAFCLFVPLPLSLIFSRIRFRRGERFAYV